MVLNVIEDFKSSNQNISRFGLRMEKFENGKNGLNKFLKKHKIFTTNFDIH